MTWIDAFKVAVAVWSLPFAAMILWGLAFVGLVAYKLGRHYLGTEISPEYIAMAEERIGSEKEKFLLLEKEQKQ